MPDDDRELALMEVYSTLDEVSATCPKCKHTDPVAKFWPLAVADPSRDWLMGFHHSSFLAGEPVAAAGEIRAKNGVLEHLSNASGHYMPPLGLLLQVILELRDRGYDCTKPPVNLEYYEKASDSYSGKAKVDAKFLLNTTKDILEAKKSRSAPQAQTKAKEGHQNEKKQSETYGFAIRYLKPDELKKLEITVEKGKLVTADKKPFDTTDGRLMGLHILKGRYIFVMSAEGKIYAANPLKMAVFRNGKMPDGLKAWIEKEAEQG